MCLRFVTCAPCSSPFFACDCHLTVWPVFVSLLALLFSIVPAAVIMCFCCPHWSDLFRMGVFQSRGCLRKLQYCTRDPQTTPHQKRCSNVHVSTFLRQPWRLTNACNFSVESQTQLRALSTSECCSSPPSS